MTRILRREVGLGGAVLLGLGSILGTGIFVSAGLGASAAGPAVILAVAIAALVATANALSSAQLAASHPVSGGTYEYGYRYLGPAWGFSAGWMFLCAKSASAATAALGFSGYLLNALGLEGRLALVGIGLAAAVGLTLLVAGGIRRSNRTNALIVSVTIVALAIFVVAGLPAAIAKGPGNLSPFLVPAAGRAGTPGLLEATALMFVAFTGYGRVATLGEEVHDPARTIPRAIVLTLVVSAVLYVTVTVIAVSAAGAPAFAGATGGSAAPLEIIARTFEVPAVAQVVAVGAVTAMLGVLLNLVLGLSRVVLAMARRADLPVSLAAIHDGTPRRAVLVVGALVTGLVAVGSVKTTWSFSAFTVLVYYALTNLAALRLPREARRYPRWIAAAGLVACLGLAFWVEARVWLAGLGLLALGLGWHWYRRRYSD